MNSGLLSPLPERLVLAAVLLFACLAMLLPAMPQPQDYHGFSDQREFMGLPNGQNVLSNLGFLLLGLYGLAQMALERLSFFSASMKRAAWVFLAGMVATAFSSSYYHLSPADGPLVIDRAGMVIAFAGVLGMVGAHRVSERAGNALLICWLAGGAASLFHSHLAGSITPYAVVQFGGIALALALLKFPARGLGPNWGLLLGVYILAKIFEMADAGILIASGGLVGGHALKHLVAAVPVLAVTVPLRKSAVLDKLAK